MPADAPSPLDPPACLPFADLGAFPQLFADYAAGVPEALRFFAGDFRDPEARRRAADRAAAHPRDHDALADALLAQNERWGLSETTRANIEALRDPETVAIVTGQQVGVLGGPLFGIYKTITTIQLAAQVAEETGRRVVPVFWMAGEDHDFDEVAAMPLLEGQEAETRHVAGPALSKGASYGPVGRVTLGDAAREALEYAESVLPNTEFKPPLLDLLRGAYHPEATFGDAFARLWRTLFDGTGLVLMTNDDPDIRRLAAPLVRHAITQPSAMQRALDDASADLIESGYHAQVQTRPANLFLLTEQGRLPLDYDGDAELPFSLRGTEQTFSEAELLTKLEAEPEAFSPNVVLRPLVQDALLPTVAYVAGPGEASYFAQYGGVYEGAGVPMPLIYPRASVTLAERKIGKLLERYDLALPELGEELDRLFRAYVLEQMDADLDAVFSEAERFLHQAIERVKPVATEVDGSLGRMAEALRASLRKELGAFKGRVIKSERQQQDQVRSHFEKAQAHLMPGGGLQERRVSLLYFTCKYGLDFTDRLRDTLALDTTQHQVVPL